MRLSSLSRRRSVTVAVKVRGELWGIGCRNTTSKSRIAFGPAQSVSNWPIMAMAMMPGTMSPGMPESVAA